MKDWIKENIDPELLNVLFWFAFIFAVIGLGAILYTVCSIALHQWGGA